MRDLLLNKTPKDFDVITTANLDQVFFALLLYFFLVCFRLLHCVTMFKVFH